MARVQNQQAAPVVPYASPAPVATKAPPKVLEAGPPAYPELRAAGTMLCAAGMLAWVVAVLCVAAAVLIGMNRGKDSEVWAPASYGITSAIVGLSLYAGGHVAKAVADIARNSFRDRK